MYNTNKPLLSIIWTFLVTLLSGWVTGNCPVPLIPFTFLTFIWETLILTDTLKPHSHSFRKLHIYFLYYKIIKKKKKREKSKSGIIQYSIEYFSKSCISNSYLRCSYLKISYIIPVNKYEFRWVWNNLWKCSWFQTMSHPDSNVLEFL